MDDKSTRDLIQILATADAVFWPVRNWNDDGKLFSRETGNEASNRLRREQ